MSTPDTMLGGWQALAAIVVMALITFALRALPFVAAGLLNRFRAIRTLGRFLPPAILGLLLIHTMAGFIQNDASTVGAWPRPAQHSGRHGPVRGAAQRLRAVPVTG